MKHSLSTLTLLLSIFFTSLSAANDLAPLKTSPFTAVSFKKDQVHVKVDDQWYQWIKMDTIETAFLLEECIVLYEDLYKKRFVSDFISFCHRIKVYPQLVEEFLLIDQNGRQITKQLTFTSENRELAKEAFKVERKSQSLKLDQRMSSAQIREDIDQLITILKRRYSYLHLREHQALEQLEAYKTELPEGITVQEFGISLQKVIAQFGDGHSRMEGLRLAHMGQLPFTATNFKGKIVFHQKGQLLHKDFPYLHSINGIPVATLLDTVKEGLLTKGSPQFVATYGADYLFYIGFILQQLEIPEKELAVILMNEGGETLKLDSTYSMTFPEKRKRRRGETAREVRNPFSWKILEDNIGYMKIESMMTTAAEEQVTEVMQHFRNTKGIIIDVRGNRGGQRSILKSLIPYFIPPEQSPIIANLARYRTDRTAPMEEGYLKDRTLYPLSSQELTEAERKKIQEHLSDFQPQLKYDEAKFSDWHFLLLRTEPEKSFYTYPVVILMDGYCFSATDIFLAAFNTLPNVTTLGTKSGGGSGRARRHQLDHSHLTVRLSTIISFQPTGELYDGQGVSPDRMVRPQSVSDITGESDHQLEEALKLLK